MKKLALLTALLLALSLSACSRVPADSPDGNDTPTAATTAPLVGENDGLTYKNTYFGLAFTPADGWDLYDSDEIAARNLPILSADDGESYADAVARAQEFYDMYAVHETTGNTIAVRVENMATMYDYLPTATEYREMQTSMLQDIPELSYEFINATVDEQPFAALKVLWGTDEYMQTDTFVYVIQDNYMLSIEFSSTDGDHTDEWLACFDLL